MARWWSFSAVEAWQQCPKKWHFRYVVKPKLAKREAPPLDIGSAVHQGLEWAALKIMAGVQDPSAIRAEAARGAEGYIEAEASYLDADQRANIMRFTASGVERLLSLPKGRQIIGVEQAIRGESLPDGAKFIGFIDRLDREGDTLDVVDYKVKKQTETRNSIFDNVQLRLYAWFMARRHPWAKRIRIAHEYPNHDMKVVAATVTREELDETATDFELITDVIEASVDFPTRTSPLCDWCDYKSMCPAWQK